MAYLYETHLHTIESSHCGVTPGRDYIRYFQDRGYQGIFVTDHFFNGNTAIYTNLPWKEWVHQFCRGYENAREEGDKLGFDVFFGWEEGFEQDEYLIYGLDKEWLLAHPQMRTWTRKQQFDAVTEGGGCVVQAHPFRERAYVSTIHLSTGCVHGVEVANAGNEPSFDALAMRYAKKLGLPMTAGSDIHSIDWSGSPLMGISFENKLESGFDYAQRIRNGRQPALVMPKDRCVWTGTETVSLPVDIRDAGDHSTEKNLHSFLDL